ncbi:hypothetical protein FCULG_00001675 [Fusarium culmorum]|uniref:DUF7053 domain-containing protein n=1 Tax=Fusarium culmorum TaxID=5516 RepID=A0A2T4GJ59_FUSCU|nr:hypothetical protein FCULG_00001675 [Fusarium culmorum]
MIDLNPLIIERHQISPPSHAPEDEKKCVWYSMTDRIDYLPGGIASGQVTYTAAFFDSSDGLQTHSYAPMGLDLRGRWSVGGTMPGERPQPVELGLGAPASGLYLREDVDMRCNLLMVSFVKKTIKKSHGTLVEKLSERTSLKSARHSMQNFGPGSPGTLQTPTPPASEYSGAPTKGANGHMGDAHQQNGGPIALGHAQPLGFNQLRHDQSVTAYRGDSRPDHYAALASHSPNSNPNSPFDERETFAELDDGTYNHPRHERTGPAELA